MTFTEKYASIFRRLLPGPLAIAVLLTLFTFILAYFLGTDQSPGLERALHLASYWERGIWDSNLLVFAFQMMLMLILGHVLALTSPVERLIHHFLKLCTNTATAAYFVTLFTLIVALFNWGLGLIVGAVFARKVAEKAKKANLPLNYPLIGAAGYSGLMVWHGGLSGSSLVKVAEPGHLKQLMSGLIDESQLEALPDAISFDQTVFSSMNLSASLMLLVFLPIAMYLIGKKSSPEPFHLSQVQSDQLDKITSVTGADQLNHSLWLTIIFGLLLLIGIILRITDAGMANSLGFITPDFINLCLLCLGILLAGSLHQFVKHVDEAISGAAGILIQFPLYFGIMGLMKSSGLVEQMSNFFISISNDLTFPLFTFISAGIVNIFVPSGGGQWAIQGPIIIQTAQSMGLSFSKSILALAYGDQLTNMLQPFWALPLLGITGLNAKSILPYTLYLMGIGAVIFTTVLIVF